MKKIVMEKYGFERSPEDDFYDDGSKFTVYRVGKIKVTKCVSQGEAFIAARTTDDRLDYERERTLLHYNSLSTLNGVMVESLTDEDLRELYDSCVAFLKEYDELVATTHYPTLDELNEKAQEVKKYWAEECNTISAYLQKDPTFIVRLRCKSASEYSVFMNGYEFLYKRAFQKCSWEKELSSMLGKASSFKFMDTKLTPSSYFKDCEKICLKEVYEKIYLTAV